MVNSLLHDMIYWPTANSSLPYSENDRENVVPESGIRTFEYETGLCWTLMSSPGCLNSLLPSYGPYFVYQKLADQPRRPWTKTRTSVMTFWVWNEGFKDPGRRGRRRAEESWYGMVLQNSKPQNLIARDP